MEDGGRSVAPTCGPDYHELMAVGIHEARRPLALAHGYLQMLLDGSLGDLPDQQDRALQRIGEKLAEARAQLDRIEVVTRLQQPSIETVDVVLEDEVRDAVARGAAKADLLGGRLEFAPHGETRARVDRTLLTQVLDNLIDNALTYSDGPPHAWVEISDSAPPSVRVTDSGPGFSAEAAAHAFDRGYRAHPEDEQRPGSGLGLYLSRSAAERMGGSLRLEASPPRGGASFVLELSEAS